MTDFDPQNAPPENAPPENAQGGTTHSNPPANTPSQNPPTTSRGIRLGRRSFFPNEQLQNNNENIVNVASNPVNDNASNNTSIAANNDNNDNTSNNIPDSDGGDDSPIVEIIPQQSLNTNTNTNQQQDPPAPQQQNTNPPFPPPANLNLDTATTPFGPTSNPLDALEKRALELQQQKQKQQKIPTIEIDIQKIVNGEYQIKRKTNLQLEYENQKIQPEKYKIDYRYKVNIIIDGVVNVSTKNIYAVSQTQSYPVVQKLPKNFPQ